MSKLDEFNYTVEVKVTDLDGNIVRHYSKALMDRNALEKIINLVTELN